MRRLYLLLAAALLLLPISPTDSMLETAESAQPSPADATALTALPTPRGDPIKIIVPSGDLLPGEDYDMQVSGLSVNDLVPGRVLFLPPEAPGVRCKLQVVWDLSGLQPCIAFRAKQPGTYRIVVVKALANEQLIATQASVVVGGEVKPPPDPVDPPLPPGPLAIAVVCESGVRPKLPAGQLAILNSLTFREALIAKGHTFKVIDPDQTPPAEWVWAIDTAGGKLPALCLRKGDKAKRLDLPADTTAALAAIGKEGK